MAKYLDPEPLHQMMYSFAPSRVLFTAARLDVFSHISSGKHTVTTIARAVHASSRGMRMLLDALVACGLITKKQHGSDVRYGLTPVAAAYLVRSSPSYLGSMVEQDTMWDSWHNLPESVISGRPSHRLDDPKRGAEFFPNLIRSLHAISWGPAKRAAQALCHEKSAGELLVLDIACGSGVWGIAIAETNRKALVTAQDFPIILNETRKYVDARKLGRRYSYLPGNLNEVDFGTLSFDVAVLGHILHIEGEVSARRLFRRLHRALRPGGRIVIAEMIPNDSRTGPQFAIFFALNMLLNTARGDTYTLSEYRTWLMRAGFIGVRTLNVGSHSPLIVARKPE